MVRGGEGGYSDQRLDCSMALKSINVVKAFSDPKQR